MRQWRMTLGLVATVFAAGFLAGVTFRSGPTAVAQQAAEEDDPCAGFYPTKTMQNFIINRVTEDMARHYKLNDVQLENTRALIRERIPSWLENNKSEIRTLTNFWFESMVSDNPPDVDEVAGWSKRVMPLVMDFTQIVQTTSDDMREFLSEDQIAMLDSELPAFNTGIDFIKQRLGAWSEGEYDWEKDWVRGPQFREQEQRRQEQVQEAIRKAKENPVVVETAPDAGATPGGEAVAGAETHGKETQPPTRDAAAKPQKVTDEWVLYVEQFEKRYKLNSDQIGKTRQILSGLMEGRDKHLAQNKDRIQAAYSRMREAKNEDDRKKAAEEYVRLNGPIDQMFEKLKQRLEKIPTRAQRTAAAKDSIEEEKAAKKQAAKKPAEPAADTEAGATAEKSPR